MHVTDLRIDDFGCFLNARLDDLSDELVVIGGPQRAGKTTFMQAIRQFPSGVSRGGDLPPATDEYRVDAEITHEGYRYRHVLNGYAAPSIAPIDGGPELDVDDLFGPVTARQYRQLFTISLDELQQLPPGIDDAEDLARVLLGGAYGDIADIPDVQQAFADGAHEIGLKRGNPAATTTDLHPPYQQIQDGIEARRTASRQVEEHDSVTDELEAKRAEQVEVDARIDETRTERDRLSVLQELFESIQRLDELDATLEDADIDAAAAFPIHRTDRLEHLEGQFDEAVEELEEAKRTFERNAELGSSTAYRDWLTANERQIDALEGDRKLLADRIERVSAEDEALTDRRAEIESEIGALHAAWDPSFEHVDVVETSFVDSAEIADLAATVEERRQTRRTLEEELDERRSRLATLHAELEEMEETEDTETRVTFSKWKPAIVATVAIAIGTGIGVLVNPLLGGLVGLVILAVGLYAIDFSTTVEPSIDTEPRQHVKGQIATLESEKVARENQLDTVSAELEDAETDLEALATDLGLPDTLRARSIADFYECVVDLARRIEIYRRDRAQWNSDREELVDALQEVDEALEEHSADGWSVEAPVADADVLLSQLEAAAADLDLAREVRTAMNDRQDCIEEIQAVLIAWREVLTIDRSTDDETVREYVREFYEQADHVTDVLENVEKREELENRITSRLTNPSAKSAFDALREDDEPWMDVVRDAAAEFVDTTSIEDEIGEIEGVLEELRDCREELREQILELETRQDELASEDDLIAAQAQIDEGRVEFERVGEAYAVNRIAEEMVSQLHERLMSDVVHSLIDDASEIFASVTRDYEGIELGGELQDLEFRALRSDGPDHEVGELSRATAEQLFLSVRLARIRQTEAELPVVIDDAATNFDPDHCSRVFDIIGELATMNQVFFLTCHPAFIKLTERCGGSTQYWLLDDGVFTRTDDVGVLERRLLAD